MWAEKRDGTLVIMPSADDMDDFDHGARVIGERVGITQSDATIEIRPLSEIEHDSSPDDSNRPKAHLFANGDLVVYISDAAIHDKPSDGVRIRHSAIQTPLIPESPFREELLHASIPPGGVLVDFRYMFSPKSRP